MSGETWPLTDSCRSPIQIRSCHIIIVCIRTLIYIEAGVLYIAFEHCQTLSYQILDVCEVSDTSYSTRDTWEISCGYVFLFTNMYFSCSNGGCNWAKFD